MFVKFVILDIANVCEWLVKDLLFNSVCKFVILDIANGSKADSSSARVCEWLVKDLLSSSFWRFVTLDIVSVWECSIKGCEWSWKSDLKFIISFFIPVSISAI